MPPTSAKKEQPEAEKTIRKMRNVRNNTAKRCFFKLIMPFGIFMHPYKSIGRVDAQMRGYMHRCGRYAFTGYTEHSNII